MKQITRRVLARHFLNLALAGAVLTPAAMQAQYFTGGNLVVAVEGDGSNTGTYTDNQAAPLTLYQYTPTGSLVNTLELPQTQVGNNMPVSGEYGSSSEGTLQLSGNGQYLTIMGYGVNATAFNNNPAAYSSTGNPALGQSGSLTGQSYTPVARVAALVDANGGVNSSTALYNVFDQNNPRSAYTVNGSTIYVSGQGTGSDATGGVFVANLGSHSATSITGTDAGSGTSQDTREVQIYNNTLYVSVDSKSGSTNRDYVGTLGTPPATSTYNSSSGPTQLTGYGNSNGKGSITITAGTANGVNSTGQIVNLSPENYFFANADTLYVADSGSPKNTSGSTSGVGDGGLQKWTLNTTTQTWMLDYTLAAGLNLVPNTNSSGSTGLYGLTGEVVNGEVELFATNYTIGDLDQTYLYEITDPLSAMTKAVGESFTEIAEAPADTNFKGVAFAPTPEPGTFALIGLGVTGLLFVARRPQTR